MRRRLAVVRQPTVRIAATAIRVKRRRVGLVKEGEKMAKKERSDSGSKWTFCWI